MCVINFYIEDENFREGPYQLEIELKWTLYNLKKAVATKFKIPIEVQKWIICNQLVSNNNVVLKSLDLFSKSEPIFLFRTKPVQTLPKSKNNKNSALNLNKSKFEKDLFRKKESVEPNIVLDPLRQWRCNVCTLINSTELMNCMACFALNPNEPNVEKKKNKKNVHKVNFQEEMIMDPLRSWKCTDCTYINLIELKNCQMCFRFNPIYKKNSIEVKNYLDMVDLDNVNLVRNKSSFECLICFLKIDKDNGVVLKDCLHNFCIECLQSLIKNNTAVEIQCPYRDDKYACNSVLQCREIRALIKDDDYNKYLNKSLTLAEAQFPNSFHCKTTDCIGWCITDKDTGIFICEVCKKKNCLQCQAIHDGFNCKQYQDYLVEFSATDTNAKKSYDALQQLLVSRQAMRCPNCNVIIVKISGCNSMSCSHCRSHFTWNPPALPPDYNLF